MRGRVALVIVVVAAVVATVVVVVVRRSPRPESSSASEPQPVRSAPPARRGASPGTPATGVDTTAPADERPGLAEVPEPPPTKETGTPTPFRARPLAEVKDLVARSIRQSVRPCVHAGEVAPTSSQSITIRYQLVVRQGLARAADLVVIDSDVADQGLAECILGGIADQEWAVVDAVPADVVVQDVIRLADL